MPYPANVTTAFALLVPLTLWAEIAGSALSGIMISKAPYYRGRCVHPVEAPSSTSTKPDVSGHKEPHVVIADSVYTPGGATKALPSWQAVIGAAQKQEPGTLSYGLLRQEGKEDTLSTLEVYESGRLREVHDSSDAVAAHVRETKSLRTGVEHHVLKVVDGFFHRPG